MKKKAATLKDAALTYKLMIIKELYKLTCPWNRSKYPDDD
jgi:hypothetical protein